MVYGAYALFREQDQTTPECCYHQDWGTNLGLSTAGLFSTHVEGMWGIKMYQSILN